MASGIFRGRVRKTTTTCMNFFNRIADQQSFMMVCRLQAVSLFLENRGKERKTSKRASVTVSVTCERRMAMPRAASSRLPMSALLAARGIVARTSRSQSWVKLACWLVLRSSPWIFEEERDCSQSRWCDNENEDWAFIHGQISGELKRPPLPPPPRVFSI